MLPSFVRTRPPARPLNFRLHQSNSVLLTGGHGDTRSGPEAVGQCGSFICKSPSYKTIRLLYRLLEEKAARAGFHFQVDLLLLFLSFFLGWLVGWRWDGRWREQIAYNNFFRQYHRHRVTDDLQRTQPGATAPLLISGRCFSVGSPVVPPSSFDQHPPQPH